MLVTARRVSSVPWRFKRSIRVACMWEVKLFQSALRQECWAFRGAVFEGRERAVVRELWSETVSWSIARVRTNCVVLPLERHRSMVEGCPPFWGWWVGVAILL